MAKIRRCFEIINCPPDMRKQCSAYRLKKNCWEYFGPGKLCCNATSIEQCKRCTNYRQHLLDLEQAQAERRLDEQRIRELTGIPSTIPLPSWARNPWILLALMAAVVIAIVVLIFVLT
ncbi:MAG TPA: hypothetical protein EYP65_05310 [Armatimonadetes bacterium]|nr:hypothetical protein [Armatimonadota bacterium]